LTHFVGVQPDNPAQLGGKIYEMMGMALSGKWSSPNQFESIQNQPHVVALSHHGQVNFSH
jgi:heat shock protein beta